MSNNYLSNHQAFSYLQDQIPPIHRKLSYIKAYQCRLENNSPINRKLLDKFIYFNRLSSNKEILRLTISSISFKLN